MFGKNKTKSERMKKKKKGKIGDKKGGGFVYIEDVNRLQNQINVIKLQVQNLKHAIIAIGILHNEAVAISQSRWRIVKACTFLLILLSLALITEQHERRMAVEHIKEGIRRHAQVHDENFRPANIMLTLCFVVGLPYLLFVFVCYVFTKLDYCDKDLRNMVSVNIRDVEESEQTDENEANGDDDSEGSESGNGGQQSGGEGEYGSDENGSVGVEEGDPADEEEEMKLGVRVITPDEALLDESSSSDCNSYQHVVEAECVD